MQKEETKSKKCICQDLFITLLLQYDYVTYCLNNVEEEVHY